MTINASLATFSPGTVISSSQVNANFQAIEQAGMGNDGGLISSDGNGNISFNGVLIVTSYLGVKTSSNGTKLMEAHNNGNFTIGGTTYYTAGGSPSLTNSSNFDGFDIAEVYQMDAEYPAGTIVCPADTSTPIPYKGQSSLLPLLTKCSHDACNLASIIVAVPGFSMGSPNVPSHPEGYDNTQPITQPVALAGRVFAKCAVSCNARAYVTSDGSGGVREIQPGEKAFSLGVALSPSVDGMVSILVRSMFVSL